MPQVLRRDRAPRAGASPTPSPAGRTGRSRATRASRCSTARRAGASAPRASRRRARRPGSTCPVPRWFPRRQRDARRRGAPDRARTGRGAGLAALRRPRALRLRVRRHRRPIRCSPSPAYDEQLGGGGLAKVAQTALIGRDAELARVEEFLGAIGSGPAALLLEGEIGIGKTALWNQGLASAAERGLRVLRCRPVECETQLAYAALGDLLADVPESAMSDLPAPAAPRARGRAPARRARGPRVAPARRQPRVCSGCCAPSRRSSRPCSRSTTSTGSTRPPRTRSRSRCGASRTSGSASSARGAAAGPTCRSASIARSRRSASSGSTLRGLSADELDLLLRSSLGMPLSAAGGRARPPRIRRQSLLRARDRARPRRARRAARSVGRAADPGEPAGARARPARAPPGRGARGGAGRSRAGAPDRVGRRRCARGERRRLGGGDRGRRARARRERLAFAHPLLATVAYQLLSESERRALHAPPRRRSSTTPRSGRGTSPRPPTAPTRRSPPRSPTGGAPRRGRAVRRTPPPSCSSRPAA